MQQQAFSIEVLVFLLNLAVYVLASYFIQKYAIPFLHESAIAICLGLLTALLLKLAVGSEVRFSDEYFFALLLPPIVFSVGYSIKKEHFFENIGTIVFLGIVSTIIAISLFAVLLIAVNDWLLGTLSSKDILLIAIVISSIDPIPALPLLKHHHAALNAALSGESVLNSAVVIILFGTVSRIDEADQQYSLSFVTTILFNFLYLFLSSFLLGVVFGLVLSWLFKRAESFSQHPIKESSLIMLTGYLVYLMGEFAGLSGIIALFTCAIVFSIYGFHNLSSESRHGTLLAFETVRYVAQAFIFAYLGACVLTTEGKASAIGVSLLLVASIPVFRFVSIALSPMVFRVMGRAYPLSVPQRKMLWYSGLMRGVISFALSLQISSINRSYMVTIALIVVTFSTITTATFLQSFAKWIGLGEIGLISFGEREEQKQIEMLPATKYGVIGEGEGEAKGKEQGFKSFQEKFIRPLFTKSRGEAQSNLKVNIET